MINLQPAVTNKASLFSAALPQRKVVAEYHPQQTIAKKVSCQGIGVHSGKTVKLTLLPAFPSNGIVFVRTDLQGQEVKANWQHVVDTNRSTTIGNQTGAIISTIEHLMAALAAHGIDNLRIEIDGPELPIMDGSASAFVDLLKEAGVKKQTTPRQAVHILKTVTVQEDKQSASLSPSSTYEIEVGFDFAGRTALETQHLTFRPLEDCFTQHIASARTFGLLEDAEKIWAMGLAKGASLENTLVYEGTSVINDEGTRYPDECVRHKVLDVMGDLHLVGGPIIGKFSGIRPGHGLHHKLLLALFADPTAWEIRNLTR